MKKRKLYFLAIISILIICNINAESNTRNIQQSVGSLPGLILDIKVDVKIRNNISIGPMLRYYGGLAEFSGACLSANRSGTSYGVRLNYMFDGKDVMGDDGWYINPYYVYNKYKIAEDNAGGDYIMGMKFKSLDGVSELGMLLGYQWFVQKGFNIKWAGGFQYAREPLVRIDNTNCRWFPNFQLTIGYAF